MLLPGGDQRQKAVVPVIRSRLRTALWARADILNPILQQISRCCNSLRAGIIDSLAAGGGGKEQLGFATVVADRFQRRPGSKKPIAGAQPRDRGVGDHSDSQARNPGDTIPELEE